MLQALGFLVKTSLTTTANFGLGGPIVAPDNILLAVQTIFPNPLVDEG